VLCVRFLRYMYSAPLRLHSEDLQTESQTSDDARHNLQRWLPNGPNNVGTISPIVASRKKLELSPGDEDFPRIDFAM
jgi:hypothetical protein